MGVEYRPSALPFARPITQPKAGKRPESTRAGRDAGSCHAVRVVSMLLLVAIDQLPNLKQTGPLQVLQ